ncbi:SAV_6107 family HEPN domain-containing protein [Streptomyces sp. NPDC007088]|uniref:SAV_6107 family HEPN domain-containing protein n=1 Tax=Streptomyces sp. NPDC007088 TaxID=3364773 RepID=UPI0036D12A8A
MARRTSTAAPSTLQAAPGPAAITAVPRQAKAPEGLAAADHRATDVHPVLRRSAAPPAALDLLAQSRAGLAEAAGAREPNERYAAAHLAALRAASAVLAVRGRPEPTERARRRIRSVWEVLPEIAPELAEWADLFASGAERRARAEAGIAGAAGPREAADLLREAAVFLRLVQRLVGLPSAPGTPEAAPGRAGATPTRQ